MGCRERKRKVQTEKMKKLFKNTRVEIRTYRHLLDGAAYSLYFYFDPRLGISVDNQMQEKFGQDVHIVVAGDTHVPVVQSISHSSYIINSGSALLPYNFNPQLGTVGYIEFTGSKEFDMWIEVLHE